MQEVVAPALAGERLDRIVALAASVTRAEAGALVDRGAVTVNGAITTHRSRRLAAGDAVNIEAGEPSSAPALEPDPSVPYTVVYEDDDIIVVDKPAGVVVHPGAGNPTGTLVSGLIHRFPDLSALAVDPGVDRASEGSELLEALQESDDFVSRAGAAAARFRPGIVHRLDKGTSGLLVVGRNRRAVRALQAQLVDHSMSRTYRALCWGHFSSVEGRIDAPIGRSGSDPTKMAIVASGRAARTSYRVEAAYELPEPMSLLTCRLETGRTHQIRVHLSAIDHPVVGDSRYGGSPWTLLRDPERRDVYASFSRHIYYLVKNPVILLYRRCFVVVFFYSFFYHFHIIIVGSTTC